ncbi:hypothetical protein [Trinickia symbiotica]|nr:hypothetical protein [Trinickia symbiotica]
MTEAIGAAQQRLRAINPMFPALIRLHEALHRCAYPVDAMDDETHQRRLNDLAGKTVEVAAAFLSCRSDLNLDTKSKIEEIVTALTTMPSWAHRDFSRSRLIELERDLRAVAGAIAAARD